MTADESFELQKKKGYLVIKSNDLIQKNRYALSLLEQKTIAYICSMIKPSNNSEKLEFQLEYDFNIREYCKICGIDYDNGKNYQNVKAVLKKLSDKSMWIQFGTKEVLCRWLSKAITDKKSGKVRIILDEDMVPYLFDLKQKFTQYQLYNVMGMKSAFSLRIYELLKSYSFQRSITFKLDELKRLLMVDNMSRYDRYTDFRRKILEKTQKEINELTDINMYFEPIKTGKKVTGIKFTIVEKFKGHSQFERK